ncbi:MAG: hypothetical protein IKK75_08190 [Clostridia bacterium]|nr:hypothetical protein [Clostridia bacterium]
MGGYMLIEEAVINSTRYVIYLRYGLYYLVECGCCDPFTDDVIVTKGTLSECQVALQTISA